MSEKIVFINQATGYLTIDIINAFSALFKETVLITGSIRVQDIELNPSVRIAKIVKYNRKSNFRKVISWISGTIQIWYLLKTRYKDYERIYFTIPPTAYLTALHFKTPFSLIIWDLYPEALLTHSFSEKGKVFSWWSKRNKKIFDKAHHIFTISEYMRDEINAYTKVKVKVIPNWSAFSMKEPVKKSENNIVLRENLQGLFIVQYSGNIGASHNVEVLIEAAEKMIGVKDLLFQIIGRGKRIEYIRKLIEKKGLINCRLLPFRKDEELFESLCAADLAVVTMDPGVPDISVPSKIYNIMSAGTPVLAIASLNSGLAGTVNKHQTGRVFDKNDIDGICNFITELKNNPMLRKTLSANSLKASADYTSANAGKYAECFKKD